MANCLGKILVSDTDEMVKIVAGLVKEGIVFFVKKYDDNATAHVRAVASNVQQIVGNSGGEQ